VAATSAGEKRPAIEPETSKPSSSAARVAWPQSAQSLEAPRLGALAGGREQGLLGVGRRCGERGEGQEAPQKAGGHGDAAHRASSCQRLTVR
jgi:hypothetical protein